ncbi:MAG: ACT domain-containing protein [Nitrospirota bacterium]|jgi:glycine cleavage system transcriptional repressor
MSQYAILTAFGQDRPGIVAALAEGLYQLGCNIEDTCTTRLRGAFTMMLMIRLPDNLSADQLASRLTPHTSPLGLTVLCRAVPDQAAERVAASDLPTFMLSVYGADHPGIVAQVARVVANHSGNITDMNTRVIGTADQPVYVMVMEIQLLEGSRPEPLQEALDRLKPTLGVDLTFRPLESVRL